MKNEKEYSKKEILKAFLRFKINILIDAYINENVVFGRIKANEKVPCRQYIEEMGCSYHNEIMNDLPLNGSNVQDGYITERDFNERCFEFYRDKTDRLCDGIPIDNSVDNADGDIYCYKHGWYEYLKNLYPLFVEIIKTEVVPDLFTAVPELLDIKEARNYYIAVSKFVLAIKTRGLRQGRRIDRYVKTLPFISPLVMRLIKKQNGHFYLKNSDINSLDYKFALLSCFRFYNEYNAKLFELKILRWEELNS